MNRTKKAILLWGALTALVQLYAAEHISGSGASFPAPLYRHWSFLYAKATHPKGDYLDEHYSYVKAPHVRVKYRSIGSGGGIKEISVRNVDFGASDQPLKGSELAKKKLLQFPAVIGSILVVVHIDGVGDDTLKLTNQTVADIFAGVITMWNDPRIAKYNPHLKLPAEKIVVVHRRDSSGTTFNFTYFLAKSSAYWKKHFGVGKTIDWAVGKGAKGNEGVADKVRLIPYSIGYVENAYKKKFKLSAAVLQTASGKWVKAHEENIKAAAKYAKWSENNSFYQLLALQPGDTSYPLVAATFILLPEEKPAKNRNVLKFFKYVFDEGDASAKRLGYIPLPDSTKRTILHYLDRRTVGELTQK